MSGWIAQRECGACGFSGPETEFMAAGMDDDGTVVLLHRDDAAPWMSLICCGCAAGYGRLDHAALRDAVWQLLLRTATLSRAAEGLLGSADVPVPSVPTAKVGA